MVEQGERDEWGRQIFYFVLRGETGQDKKPHAHGVEQGQSVTPRRHRRDTIGRNGNRHFCAVCQSHGAQFSVEQSKGRRIRNGQLPHALHRPGPRSGHNRAPPCLAFLRIPHERALLSGQTRHNQDVAAGEQLLRRDRDEAGRIEALDPVVEMECFTADRDIADDKAARRVSAFGHQLACIILAIPWGGESVEADAETVEGPFVAQHAHELPLAIVKTEAHRAVGGGRDETDFRRVRCGFFRPRDRQAGPADRRPQS